MWVNNFWLLSQSYEQNPWAKISISTSNHFLNSYKLCLTVNIRRNLKAIFVAGSNGLISLRIVAKCHYPNHLVEMMTTCTMSSRKECAVHSNFATQKSERSCLYKNYIHFLFCTNNSCSPPFMYFINCRSLFSQPIRPI